MKDLLEKYIANQRVLILGFGREGRSTYRLLRTYFPDHELGIADQDPWPGISETANDKHLTIHTGKEYLKCLDKYPIIIKSPGIPLAHLNTPTYAGIILSQTSLFLEQYRDQIVGITGTKGKSTTASLIYHVLKQSGKKTLLVGNIGLPPFDFINKIKQNTIVVFELSAHQLEITGHSPHVAILLNIFQEHLDHFNGFERYTEAKMNICKFQGGEDYFIFNGDDVNTTIQVHKKKILSQKIAIDINSFKSDGAKQVDLNRIALKGRHNLININAATQACLNLGIKIPDIHQGIYTFKPLPHRLEYIGNTGGVDYYNDSISTVPESTIEAINSISNVQTLILGGFDRGIDYQALVEFLLGVDIEYFIFMGPAGKRIMSLMKSGNNKDQAYIFIDGFNCLDKILPQLTNPGKVCLLSPAAASYDRFKNFEHRGDLFKEIVNSLYESVL
nr:UDP-N-acetylmuramoyl-L-alanine--D-glutamate ligase [Bacteroidota bacterium]